MAVDHALALGFVRLEGPHAALRRAAEDDAVVARHHVDAETAGLGGHATVGLVIHLGLRRHHGQLTFERHQFLVAEQISCAEAGAVDHDRLAQRRQLARRLELADDDVAAPELAGLKELTAKTIPVEELLRDWLEKLSGSLAIAWRRSDLSDEHRRRAARLVAEKYASPVWTNVR